MKILSLLLITTLLLTGTSFAGDYLTSDPTIRKAQGYGKTEAGDIIKIKYNG